MTHIAAPRLALPLCAIALAAVAVEIGAAQTPATPPSTPAPARPTAPDTATPERRELKLPDGTIARYALIVPPHQPGAALPLVLALHGRETLDGTVPEWAGERFLQALFQPGLASLGAIMVGPDAPVTDWTDSASLRTVSAVLAEIRRQYTVDERRTLVAGFSMGGIGAWYFASNHSTEFRAALAVAGLPQVWASGPVEDIQQEMAADTIATWTAAFHRIPIYVIHSRIDEAVPFEPDSIAVARIRAKGGMVEFLPLDDIEHSPASLYQAQVRTTAPWIERQWARP